MNRAIPSLRRPVHRRVMCRLAAVAIGVTALGSCSTTSNHEITCNSTEVAPHTQPGSDTAEGALQWYLENDVDADDAADYELTSSSENRHVFSNGSDQISASALPSDEGEPRVWVVLMTYDCD